MLCSSFWENKFQCGHKKDSGEVSLREIRSSQEWKAEDKSRVDSSEKEGILLKEPDT